LIVMGTPSRAPTGSPALHRTADSSAARREPSASTRHIALTAESWAPMRSRAASVASTGERLPLRYASSSSVALRSATDMALLAFLCAPHSLASGTQNVVLLTI